jgi:hypothetical protein
MDRLNQPPRKDGNRTVLAWLKKRDVNAEQKGKKYISNQKGEVKGIKKRKDDDLKNCKLTKSWITECGLS